MKLKLIDNRSVKHKGDGGYAEYRIPAIRAIRKNTVLLACECRRETENDWASIDIMLMISHDGGCSWDEQMIACSAPEDCVTWNNPTLICENNRIHMLYCKNYEHAFHIVSEDEGRTWSSPVEITSALREFSYAWNVCAVGPGHGIALPDDRLAVCIWLANGAPNPQFPRVKMHHPSTAGIMIFDPSQNCWHAGALVDGLISANETTLARMSEKELLLNFRHRGLPMRRALAVYHLDTGHFDPVFQPPDLPDPMCFGSMENLEQDTIAFAHCESTLTGDEKPEIARNFPRTSLTIRTSRDFGKTWRSEQCIDVIGGYADLAVQGKNLYAFYERTVGNTVSELRLAHYRMI